MPNVPQLAAAQASLALSSFGETVTHRPLGNSDNDASLTAIVELREPQRIEEGGRGVKREAELAVASSVSVDVRDRWQFRGGWWETITLNVSEAGLITLDVRQVEDETRHRARTVL